MATKKADSYSIDLRDLLEAGCHFGHQVRRWNPRMNEYIYTNRDGVHVFDLQITAEKLIAAMEFVRSWVAEGKDIVFVGTKRQAAAIVREEAVKAGAPYVDTRWLGGTLTNWEQMYKRIKRLNSLIQQKESGELAKKHTKKEQVLLDREIARLQRFFGGISKFTSAPTALFIVDTHREITAVKEANILDIPVVGMVDTNGDPTLITHPIPVNDDAIRSIKLVVSHIAKAYADGKNLQQKGGQVDTTEKKEEKVVDEKKTEKKVKAAPAKKAVGTKKAAAKDTEKKKAEKKVAAKKTTKKK